MTGHVFPLTIAVMVLGLQLVVLEGEFLVIYHVDDRAYEAGPAREQCRTIPCLSGPSRTAERPQ